MPDVKPEPGDLLVILRPAEEGGYIVLSPDIPGLITEGESVPHALSMAADAAEGLERAKQPRRPLSEVFAEIGAACGGAFDGVDPAKYVAEGRGEEPPGEWSANPPTGGPFQVRAADGRVFAECERRDDADWLARLLKITPRLLPFMLAFPDLLAALKAARKAWLHEAAQGDGIAEENAQVLAQIDAAIAKAEGGAPCQ